MAQDITAEEHVETILHHAGVGNSGEISSAIIDTLRENGMLLQDPITPTMGPMDDKEHMAFILRIFMHFVEQQPAKHMQVDLRQVLASTKGRQMQVMLNGHVFQARTIADLIVPTAEDLGMLN